MIIGLPKETLPGETRIAFVPSEIKRATSDQLSFQIETGAGLEAYFSDDSFLFPFYSFSEIVLLLCNPHSIFLVPFQRPDLSSSPAHTGLVHCLHPILG
mgnify:CR=1 FL=1